MRTKTGTVAYSAPEIFTQNVYDYKVDIWSAGIVLYMMLSGKQPYEGENMVQLMKMITSLEKPPHMDSDLKDISMEARDLIEQMLTKDPKQRPDANVVMGHVWLARSSNIRLSTAGSLALSGVSDKLGQRRQSKIEGRVNLAEIWSVKQLMKELLEQGLDQEYNFNYQNCHGHFHPQGGSFPLKIKHAHSVYQQKSNKKESCHKHNHFHGIINQKASHGDSGKNSGATSSPHKKDKSKTISEKKPIHPHNSFSPAQASSLSKTPSTILQNPAAGSSSHKI